MAKRQFIREIKKADIGVGSHRLFGGRLDIGRVLPGDVGKRVYLVKSDNWPTGIYQIENDEQRDEREGRGA